MARKELHDVAAHAAAVIAAAATLGIASEQLVAAAAFPIELLEPLAGLISYAQLGRLIDTAVALTGNPSLGLAMAGRVPAPDAGALHFDLISITNAGEALRYSYDLLAQMSNAFRVDFDAEDSLARVAFTPAREGVLGIVQMTEFHAAFFTFNYRAFTDPDDHPTTVYFRHAAPPQTAPYASYFQCPVHFGAAANEVEFDAAILQRPMRTANPDLRKAIEPLVQELRAGMPNPDALTRAARRAVQSQLGLGRVTLARIAQQLHVPPRGPCSTTSSRRAPASAR